MECVHSDQANSDFFFLCELVRDYLGIVSNVKEIFQVGKEFFFPAWSLCSS